MDFVFVKKINNSKLDLGSFSFYDDKCLSNRGDAVFFYKKDIQRSVDSDNNTLFLSGRVHKVGLTQQDSANACLDSILTGNWPLDNSFTGTFSGVAFNQDRVFIFNDPIGLYKLFYYISEDYIIVSTTLINFKKFGEFKLREAMLVMEVIAPEFSQYGVSSVLEHVNTLLPGELVIVNDVGKVTRKYDTSIKQTDKVADKNFAQELVTFIDDEFKEYYKEKSDITIPMSGGVDSRVILAPILKLNKKVKLSNYGKPEFIDSKIPQQIAKKFDLDFEIFDPIPSSFPKKELVWDVIEKTDSLHVHSWLGYFVGENIEQLPDKETFLLGDMCDILRAKAISSLQSRAFRKGYYKSQFFRRKKIKLTPITKENKEAFQKNKKNAILNNAKEVIKNFKNAKQTEQELLSEIEIDIDQIFQHMERYNPKYIESYEELYGIFTHGRKSMGKQVNLLKYKYNVEIPLLNMRIIRKVLNYSPSERYSDELTNKMFKLNKSWKALGNFRTSQNPFISYNSNYFLMIFGWFLRSGIDQKLMKRSMKSKGKITRSRLFKSFNSLDTYKYKGAFENFSSYIENDLISFDDQKQVFKNRMEGNSWPLTGMDLIVCAQAAYYIEKFWNNTDKN